MKERARVNTRVQIRSITAIGWLNAEILNGSTDGGAAG